MKVYEGILGPSNWSSKTKEHSTHQRWCISITTFCYLCRLSVKSKNFLNDRNLSIVSNRGFVRIPIISRGIFAQVEKGENAQVSKSSFFFNRLQTKVLHVVEIYLLIFVIFFIYIKACGGNKRCLIFEKRFFHLKT